MEEFKILNPKQILLLCVIRKGIVRAKNLAQYDWTFPHWAYVQHKLIELPKDIKSEERSVEEDKFKIEAVKKFPSQLSCMRNFYARFGDFISLADQDGDLSWHSPYFAEEPQYKENFELEVGLNEKEIAIIRAYCS